MAARDSDDSVDFTDEGELAEGMHYMVAHHIVVQHKLNEHCAQRFVSNKHFSKLLLFCTY